MRRLALGLSQREIGEALDISFQQVKKYELRLSEISAGRLYQLVQVLGVGLAYFLDDVRGEPPIRHRPPCDLIDGDCNGIRAFRNAPHRGARYQRRARLDGLERRDPPTEVV